MRRVDLVEPMVLVLEGDLTEDLLSEALGDADQRLASGPRALLVDCTTMVSYSPEARALFVRWTKGHKGSLTHVGIVTANAVWQVVIATMALASTQEMEVFDTLAAARRWVDLGPEDTESEMKWFTDG